MGITYEQHRRHCRQRVIGFGPAEPHQRRAAKGHAPASYGPQLLGRFDTRAGEQLFRSFTSALTLFGAEAGARFMTENAGSIRSLSSSQQAAFSSVLSDAKDVAFLRQEATRLANLPSLEALLSRIELK